uniref:Uncharacterized protein n=2 Tax=Caenorhabditis japonica TaxID=281687 RepID=A0A8R1IU93_CAEJA
MLKSGSSWSTRTKNALLRECDEAEKLITEIAKFTPEQILENDDSLFTKINEMTSSIKATESALEKLAMTAEGLDPDNDVEQSKFEEQADKVNDVILRGVQARDKRMAQRERRLLIRNSQHDGRVKSPRVSVSENALTPRRIRHLKIPKFSGDRWQWQNFWTIFEELIDTTEDSAILKFNELKNHLDGEAKDTRCTVQHTVKELIEKYLVTEDNYALAINLLKERYDDSESTIAELNDRFKFAKATNTSIREQRKLWDKIHILLQQLDTLGENIDHYMVKDAIVEKFIYDIRKEIYERKYKLSDVNYWTIEQLIYDIEETIKHQEKLRKKLKLKDEENPKDLQRNKPKKYDEK